jgi:hypothetical protein
LIARSFSASHAAAEALACCSAVRFDDPEFLTPRRNDATFSGARLA